MQCEPIRGRVQKILFWRWKEPDVTEDELDHVSPHKHPATQHKQREFLIKWHEMSFWHCEWITELQVRKLYDIDFYVKICWTLSRC